MGIKTGRTKTTAVSLGPYIVRIQSDTFLTSNEIAQAVENMFPMEEGTLRSVWGPAPLVVDSGGLAPLTSAQVQAGTTTLAPSAITTSGGPVPAASLYGALNHGIFHCLLRGGERDVLLLHTGNELWEFQGWERGWRQLLSDPAVAPGLRDRLIDDDKARFPTQFEATGNGVVIVPQEGRAYFYDGVAIAPLGFEQIPSSPQGRGPQSIKPKGTDTGGVNDSGYAHDALAGAQSAAAGVHYLAAPTGMTYGFGLCRVGSTQIDQYSTSATTGNTGWLLAGQWRCAVQLVDRWGNLSALSAPSDAVVFEGQAATYEIGFAPPAVKVVSSDRVRKQIAWVGVSTGPDHCIGRILYRTKDLINSGTTDLFELPQDATANATAFATLPDNVSTIYPDNIPDGWLTQPPIETVAVPRFRLCRVAFGRLWIANMPDAEGMVRPSLPGRWGTFEKNKELYPDPSGGEITGLWRVDSGLLVFTSKSTFLVTLADDGGKFRATPIASNMGCVAPSSLGSLPDGLTLWVGHDGFYSFDGTTVATASIEVDKLFRRVTRSRLAQACATVDPRTKEYRCWVSIDGSVENNLCFIYDGQGWRTRTDTNARAVCTTRDHRQYVLVAGQPTLFSSVVKSPYTSIASNGVYVLDHVGSTEDSALNLVTASRESFVETTWLEAANSLKGKTAFVVYLWLRESEDAEITVEVMRDWRSEIVETITLKRYSTEDIPDFWDTAVLDAASTVWVDRRPYWTRGHIYVPSASSFKFRIRGTGFWEFLGLQVDESPRYAGGAHVPP